MTLSKKTNGTVVTNEDSRGSEREQKIRKDQIKSGQQQEVNDESSIAGTIQYTTTSNHTNSLIDNLSYSEQSITDTSLSNKSCRGDVSPQSSPSLAGGQTVRRPLPKVWRPLTTSPNSSNTANPVIHQALRTLNIGLESLSQRRRVPLCFPVIDLNSLVEQIEGSALSQLSEEYLIGQMYLEVSTIRKASFASSCASVTSSFTEQFSRQTDEVRSSLTLLDSDVRSLLDACAQTLHEQEMIHQTKYEFARHEVIQIRVRLQDELKFCFDRLEQHDHIVCHSTLFTFYETLLLLVMQMMIACRFVPGAYGTNKERYRARMSKCIVLSNLVKKGIEISHWWYPMPRFKKANVCIALLERNVKFVHDKHLMLRSYVSNCSEFALFAAAVQEASHCIARTLTCRFEEQIMQLIAPSSYLLATYAARAMATILKRDAAVEQTSITAFLIAAVQDESVLNMRGLGISVKKEKLETVRGVKLDSWNAVGVFRKTGVRLIDFNKRLRFYEGGLFKGNPGKYGYRCGSERECLALGMTETPIRQRIDMAIVDASGLDTSGGNMASSEHSSIHYEPQYYHQDANVNSVSDMELVDKECEAGNNSYDSHTTTHRRFIGLEQQISELNKTKDELFQRVQQLYDIMERHGLL